MSSFFFFLLNIAVVVLSQIKSLQNHKYTISLIDVELTLVINRNTSRQPPRYIIISKVSKQLSKR